ncbi:MAG: T9SS type A sorting domain-containing protein [Candidatus Kapaibacterium sp.]
MKLFLKITLFFLFPLLANAQYEKLTHYNIFNNVLDVLNLEDENFLLYGNFGGVLRTSDAGTSWDQKFSGTHNDILSIQKLESNLYGITRNGEFIVSTDNGSKWEINKISNQFFSDFYIDGNSFYISQFTDSIMYSNDLGVTWQSKFVANDTLKTIYSKDNQIIVNRNYKELLTTDGSGWAKFDNPKFNFGKPTVNIRARNNKLYFISTQDIAILNENMEWDEYSTGISGISEVLETETHLLCFVYNQFTNESNVLYFNKSSQLIEKTESLTDPRLYKLSNRVTYANIDSEGNIIATSVGKTIFQKKKDDPNWKTVNSFMIPNVDALNWLYFYDKDTWRFMTYDGNFLKTNNGGNTFSQGEHFTVDTIDEKTIRKGRIEKVRYITPDSILVSITNNTMNKAISTDGGSTFSKFNVDNNAIFIKDYGDYEVYYRNYSLNSNYTIFFKKYNSGVIDTLFKLDAVTTSIIKEYQGKLLLTTKVDSEGNFDFYLTDENLTNPELVYSLKYEYESSQSSFISSIIKEFVVADKDIYLFATRTILENLQSFTRVYKIASFENEPEIVLDETPIYFYLYDYNLGDDKLVTIGIDDYETGEIKYYYSKISIENGFDYELISELVDLPLLSVHHAINDNTMYFYSQTGHFWKPIEEDRIPTTVEEELKPPPIWTMSPYPNPAKDNTRIQFYTGNMADINALEFSVINISTGKRVENLNYSIESNNQWNGTVNLDTKNMISGSYLLEFKIGTASSTQKLIINR